MILKKYWQSQSKLINIGVSFTFIIFSLLLLPIYKLTPLYILSVFLLFLFAESSKVDFEKRIIPSTHIVIGLSLGCIESLMYFTIDFSFYNTFNDAIIGLTILPLILLGFTLLLEFIFKKELFGMGDIKAIIVVGFLMGYQYQYLFLLVLFIISFLGSTILAIKNKSMHVAIPMAPFMLVALFITLFVAGIAIT